MMKTLKNGHDEPKTPSQSPSARRQRLAKSRKARGAVCIQSTVEADLITALCEFGWLPEEQKRDAGAVHDALSALTFQALSAGMRPARSGKAFLPISLEVIQAAASWLKPGVQLTAETAGNAVGTAVKAAHLSGFGPAEYAEHVQKLIDAN
jgi:hypothetical protein